MSHKRMTHDGRTWPKRGEGRPYYTTYPRPGWFWFDVAVYGEFPPKIGNLPTELFKKLTGGMSGGASRKYETEQEALDDLTKAKGA